MSDLPRPTLRELASRIESDLLARAPVGWGILTRSFIRILSKVFAGICNLLFGFLDQRALQAFPQTATGDGLEAHATEWGITRLAATAASGDITPTGTAGINIPMYTVFTSAEGIEYQTQSAITLPDSVTVLAQETGVVGNLSEADILIINTPIPGVDDEALVDSGGITGGQDIESDERLRARILARIQYSPAGGTEADYIAWVLDNYLAATRVWVISSGGGGGTVWIYFVEDLEADIIPISAHVTAVQAIIDSKAPVGSIPTVKAPDDKEIVLTMTVTPDTAAVQAAVQESLDAYFTDNTNLGTTVLLSQLDEAISLSAGETDHTITLIEVGQQGGPYTSLPVGDIGIGATEVPISGTHIFT